MKSRIRSKKLKLVKIVRSPKKDKKYMAVFEKDGRTKSIHFGATGYSDFTKHHDVERKKRYITRHRSRENWKNLILLEHYLFMFYGINLRFQQV